MATKPKAILSTHDGREASPITKASNVLFENGQTAQDILNDRQDAMISPVIENSSSMFKVGQGDNVDYSANVVNGAYESMVLKGKSMVNCIQEPSSQDVVLPYEFADGQYVTINDTKESGALGVELKGQTLVNLVKKLNNDNVGYGNEAWKIQGSGHAVYSYDANKGITLTNTVQGSMVLDYMNLSLFKPNTEYTLFVDVNWNGVGVAPHLTVISTREIRLNNGFNIIKFTSVPDLTVQYMCLRLGYAGTVTVGCEYTFNNIMVLEGDWTNVDIPYFEGMTSCKMPILHTVGKNLIDYKNYNLKANAGQNPQEIIIGENQLSFNVNEASWVSLWYDLYLESGENYKLSYDTNLLKCFIFKSKVNTYTNSELIASATVIDATEDKIQKVEKTFTAPSTGFIRIRLTSEQKMGNHTLQNFQIEKGTTATTYEAHKSSILSLPEEVVLRSLPNGVCDTFNTRTGVYTQRIKEKVLNGGNSESWVKSGSFTGTSCIRFQLSLSDAYVSENTIISITNDKFPNYPNSSWQEDVEQVNIDISNRMSLNILKTKLTSEDVSGLRAWLSQNPTTICYELETPIVTKINLSSTLKSWNTTTHIYSEIPENTLCPILSHSNPTYPVILKPSTKYSIVANSYSNSHTNSAINFNLGGATASTTVGNRVTTITTPSTLSNELLTMSGRGNKLNNVMVIEGDVMGDEPYFEGICDCKSPILSNVGKNLFDVNQTPSYVTKNTTYSIANNEVTINSTGETNYPRIIYTLDKKLLGKTIFVSYDVVKNTSNNWILQFVYTKIDGTKDYKNCRVGIPITLPNEITGDLTIGIYADNTSATGTAHTLILKNIQIEEGSVATPYEPYKSNILSCNGDKIELTEDMFEQGGVYFTKGQSFADATNNTASDRIRLKTLLNLKPNTTYHVAIDNAHKVGVQLYNNEKLAVSDTGWVSDTTFTTKGGENAVALVIRKLSSTANISMSHFKNIKLQLSEVDKTIVLRSLPNGVCDTLNVETGEYIKRIGKVVLNGSQTIETWWNTTSTVGVRVNIPTMKNISNMICDRLPVKYYRDINNNTYDTEGIASWDVGNSVYFRILKSKLETEDINGVKKYLAINPVTVQYELEVPIVETVDLSGFPFSYENGHVILSSGSIEQSLTPKVEYSVATNRNGQIRSNQKMVERHQKQLDQLQAIILANLVNSQYNQTLTTLKYELSRV